MSDFPRKVRATARSGSRCRALACLGALVAMLGIVTIPPGSAGAATSPAPLTWSAKVPLANPPFDNAYNLAAVTCPTSHFCVASDSMGNVLTSADPAGGAATWSSPQPAHNDLVQISCPLVSFCAGVGSAGIDTSTAPQSKSGWKISDPHSAIPHANSISCPSTNLCVVAGQGQIYFSTDPAAANATWQATVFGRYPAIESVSCPAPSFCAAVATNGTVYTSSDPSGGKAEWTATDVDGTVGMFDISCPSASYCIAVDDQNMILYSGDPAGGAAQWHRVSGPGQLMNVSCVSASLCLAAGYTEVYLSSDPGAGRSTWQESDVFQKEGAQQVSCVPGFCAAIQLGLLAITSEPASATHPWSFDYDIDGWTDFAPACPSVRLCVVGDGPGRVLVSTDPTGGPAAWSAVHVGGIQVIAAFATTFYDFTCASTTFCVAADGEYQILTSADPTGGPAHWHVASAPADTVGFSCPSRSLCVSIDNSSFLWVSEDPGGGLSKWQVRKFGLDPLVGGFLDQVVCPSTHLCVAAATWNGQITPSLLVTTDPTGSSAAWKRENFDMLSNIGLSCPSASLCVADGYAAIGNASYQLTTTDPTGGRAAWHVSRGPVGNLICPSTAVCYLFDPSINGKSLDNEMLTTTDPAAADPTWHASPAPADLGGVTCPTVSLCVAGYNTTSYGGIRYGIPG